MPAQEHEICLDILICSAAKIAQELLKENLRIALARLFGDTRFILKHYRKDIGT